MKRTPTSRRISEELRSKIANIILLQIADPRLELVTVTSVNVSRDRGFADVFVSADKNRYSEVKDGLSAAKGHIRSLLSKSLDWRVTPELRFHIDTTLDDALRIAAVLESERKRLDS